MVDGLPPPVFSCSLSFLLTNRFGEGRHPVLPNCDDSLTKDLFIDQGWRQQILEREGLYDLVFDPHETHNLVTDSNYREILENLRRRLDQWMRNTGDPLAHGGPVAPPATAVVNDPDALSPSEPHYPAREFLGLNR